ncbi:MAG: bifunctional 5,10-methylenetetrahydrofolate dehydrogenase/5,10-methenyltetrahydrofolate cyclohydrolase [Candidatus Omnitrophota bacterium]
MSKIIDGKEIAERINMAVKEDVRKLSQKRGRAPKLASLTVGNKGDAEIYVNMQRRNAEKVGIEFASLHYEDSLTQEGLFKEIEKLNRDDSVTAIIVQKPLPDGISHNRVVAAISPGKDAEGIHPYNLGRILRREAELEACTPGAVMEILRMKEIDLYGKEVVIIGSSAIVGKPLSLMLLNEMATTTVCNIATFEKGDLPAHALRADILIVAVGKAEMVKADWVAKGAVVIDVGINKKGNEIVGDVAFSEVEKKASLITPVPGGVGPITVSILMRNVFRADRDKGIR